ncbi:nitrogenase component 1 [Methanobrevibacter sp.]|uniref:nitrogenase component 1 n=1 Tax=Methanobrevibacter sp. TaxID=66852 RepID=UPI0025EB6F02|nr:nitrogenase component 1 [Methanobrevibacter sp.]
MSSENTLENKSGIDTNVSYFEREAVEAPRYSCALAGVYGTTLGIRGGIPILHSGAGCGVGQLFGTLYAGGESAGGNEGGTSTPCSCLVEEHVILGGEEKLRNLIESTIEIANDELFVVTSGCVPSLIGDDVDQVVDEFRDKAAVIHVNAPGFKANSPEGYNLFWDAIIDQLLPDEAGDVEEKTVNIFGIVPYNHVYWKGDLLTIKNLLGSIGIKANIIFSEKNGLDHINQIPQAEYNIVVNPWLGVRAVEKLEEKYGTPFIKFPNVPVGAKQTAEFLRTVGEKIGVPEQTVENFISQKEDWYYRLLEYPGDAIILVRPNSFYAVAAESSYAIAFTKFLANELGYLPDIIQITDNPPIEVREEIISEIRNNLDTVVQPDIIFEADTYKIRKNLEDRPFLFLFSSSIEAPTSIEDYNALHIPISYPIYNRAVLAKHYGGYEGGLTVVEDVVSGFVGPL